MPRSALAPLACAVLCGALACAPARAQQDQLPAAPALPDSLSRVLPAEAHALDGSPHAETTEDPNAVPYASPEPGLGRRLLALPALPLRLVKDGLERTIKWAEHSGTTSRVLALYFAPPGQGARMGVKPLVGVDDNGGFGGGLVLFHHDVGGTDRHVRLRVSAGTAATYGAALRFYDPGLFASPVRFNAQAVYDYDGRDRFYPRGNDSAEDALIRYRSHTATAGFRGDLPLGPRVALYVTSDYLHRIVRDRMDEPAPPEPGLGPADVVTAEGGLTLDLTRRAPATVVGAPRRTGGVGLRVGYGLGMDAGAGAFGWNGYSAEAWGYVPVGFLPATRRLALGARLDIRDPIEGKRVPFWALPALGQSTGLRGYAGGRFRDRGALALTAEYRYPILPTADALLFLDGGQVFGAADDLDVDAFHWGYGFGFRVYGGGSVAASLDLGFGAEGPRLTFGVGGSF